MNLFLSLYLAALFVALTPGVLLTLPKGGARLTVAVVHALVFAVIYHFTKNMVLGMSYEGFLAKGTYDSLGVFNKKPALFSTSRGALLSTSRGAAL